MRRSGQGCQTFILYRVADGSRGLVRVPTAREGPARQLPNLWNDKIIEAGVFGESVGIPPNRSRNIHPNVHDIMGLKGEVRLSASHYGLDV